MKKVGILFLLFLCLIGCVGGIGTCILANEYVFAIGLAALTIVACPTIVDYFKELLG